MKTYIFIILGIILIIVLLYIFISMYLTKFLSYPKKHDNQWALNFDIEKGLIPKDMSYLKRQEIKIVARDGQIIEGDFSPHENQKGIIILAHGYTWTREGCLKYAQFLYKHGYSIFLFDERSHGKSKYEYTTMGYLESKDICDIVAYLRKVYGEEVVIGLHGESMGAASVMMALGQNINVQFAIEDCGYASLKELIKYKLKCMHLPVIFCYGSNFFLKRFEKYHLEDVNPADEASKSNIPLLIIHGNEDDFVPFKDSKVIYEKNKNHATLYVANGAKHAQSYEVDPLQYEKVVIDFINKAINKE
ncbi:MAG: alpha/beta hydrolase [Erysipelotrichaceae bacterium]|nr:alpha/beta hydrolase [Erysipelotrichaceae bacterium]